MTHQEKQDYSILAGIIIVCCILLGVFCLLPSGCEENTHIYTTNQGILSIPAKSKIFTNFTEPNALPIVVEEDGWYVSDFYMTEIMRVKIK